MMLSQKLDLKSQNEMHLHEPETLVSNVLTAVLAQRLQL